MGCGGLGTELQEQICAESQASQVRQAQEAIQVRQAPEAAQARQTLEAAPQSLQTAQTLEEPLKTSAPPAPPDPPADNSATSSRKSDENNRENTRNSDAAHQPERPRSTQQPWRPVKRNPQSQLFKLDENEVKMEYEQALEQYEDEYQEADRVRKETSVLHMGLPDTSRSYCLPCLGEAPRDEKGGIEVKLDIDVDSVDEEDEGLNIIRLFE